MSMQQGSKVELRFQIKQLEKQLQTMTNEAVGLLYSKAEAEKDLKPEQTKNKKLKRNYKNPKKC